MGVLLVVIQSPEPGHFTNLADALKQVGDFINIFQVCALGLCVLIHIGHKCAILSCKEYLVELHKAVNRSCCVSNRRFFSAKQAVKHDLVAGSAGLTGSHRRLFFGFCQLMGLGRDTNVAGVV